MVRYLVARNSKSLQTSLHPVCFVSSYNVHAGAGGTGATDLMWRLAGLSFQQTRASSLPADYLRMHVPMSDSNRHRVVVRREECADKKY
eukprot:768404-Hanusia_phi.AAC.6